MSKENKDWMKKIAPALVVTIVVSMASAYLTAEKTFATMDQRLEAVEKKVVIHDQAVQSVIRLEAQMEAVMRQLDRIEKKMDGR